MKDNLTIIRQLNKIEYSIHQVPYDELTYYLKWIRDIINLLNGEEHIFFFLFDIVFTALDEISTDLELPF